MARKTATYVTCDGPNCSVVAEIVDEAKDAPEGWYHVMPAVPTNKGGNGSDPEFTYQRSIHFEFHSLSCLGKWARERRNYQENKSSRSSPPTSTDVILNSIETAFGLLSEREQEWVKVDDLTEVTELHSTTVRKYINNMAQAGLVEVKNGKSSRNIPMKLYRRIPGREWNELPS